MTRGKELMEEYGVSEVMYVTNYHVQLCLGNISISRAKIEQNEAVITDLRQFINSPGFKMIPESIQSLLKSQYWLLLEEQVNDDKQIQIHAGYIQEYKERGVRVGV